MTRMRLPRHPRYIAADQQSLEEEVEHLLDLLEKRGLIPAAA